MKPPRARGTTILETMMAMVILAIGLVGTLAAFNQGAREQKLGQTRQMKMMLADAALQRIKLQDKNAFFTGLPAQPTTNITNVPVGSAPWTIDTTPVTDPSDISQGGYFRIFPDGTVTHVTTIPSGTPCTAALVQPGTICREVFNHLGGPFNGTNPTAFLPGGTRTATAWVRVSRKVSNFSPLEVDIVLNTVVVQ